MKRFSHRRAIVVVSALSVFSVIAVSVASLVTHASDLSYLASHTENTQKIGMSSTSIDLAKTSFRASREMAVRELVRAQRVISSFASTTSVPVKTVIQNTVNELAQAMQLDGDRTRILELVYDLRNAENAVRLENQGQKTVSTPQEKVAQLVQLQNGPVGEQSNQSRDSTLAPLLPTHPLQTLAPVPLQLSPIKQDINNPDGANPGGIGSDSGTVATPPEVSAPAVPAAPLAPETPETPSAPHTNDSQIDISIQDPTNLPLGSPAQ